MLTNTPYAIRIVLGQARWLDASRARTRVRASTSYLSNKSYLEGRRRRAPAREPGQEVTDLNQPPPEGWVQEGSRFRQSYGLVEINLMAEWRKFVLWYAEHGREISLPAWLRWAFRAYRDHTNELKPAGVTPDDAIRVTPLPAAGTDRERARVHGWVRTGKWAIPSLRDAWGPAPDQPGCTLPPALVAWALAGRPSTMKENSP